MKIKKGIRKIRKFEREVKEADLSIKKAKKEILEAEEAANIACEEVVDVAIISKGKMRKKLSEAARNLEKAAHLTAESCESTEEAEVKFKESQRKWD